MSGFIIILISSNDVLNSENEKMDYKLASPRKTLGTLSHLYGIWSVLYLSPRYYYSSKEFVLKINHKLKLKFQKIQIGSFSTTIMKRGVYQGNYKNRKDLNN